LILAVRLWSLKINCNHVTQCRGGFSPPGPMIEAPGGEKGAPTLLLQLIFKDHQAGLQTLRLLFLPAFFEGLLGLFVSPAFDLAQFDRQPVSGGRVS
jgi:hypothetical protein